MKGKSNCDCCIYNVYNEDYECYECMVNLDEDEMGRYLSDTFDDCSYFRIDDEYKIVKKQM